MTAIEHEGHRYMLVPGDVLTCPTSRRTMMLVIAVDQNGLSMLVTGDPARAFDSWTWGELRRQAILGTVRKLSTYT